MAVYNVNAPLFLPISDGPYGAALISMMSISKIEPYGDKETHVTLLNGVQHICSVPFSSLLHALTDAGYVSTALFKKD